MIHQIRVLWPNIQGERALNFGWPPINAKSVVHMSISEADVFVLPLGPSLVSRFVGAARMSVNNISPHQGGVTFRVTVEWERPLNIALDITVFDPPDLVYDVAQNHAWLP